MNGLGKASTLIAAGTLVSRVTGLLRTIVLVGAIGALGSRAGDAFTTANQLPNTIFAIISTGLLTAVIVPQIVKVSADPDGGRAFISKLFTLSAFVLLGVTAVAMVLAPFLVQLWAPKYNAEQLALGTAFAYWCLPQILFYGLYAIVGETLNARRIFGPFAWAPIMNNVVSIAGFGVFIALFGGEVSAVDRWTPDMITLLGAVATGGIAAQAGTLVLFWRRTGLKIRPDFRWRGVGLGQIGHLAGWTFLMVIVGQLAALVQSRIVSDASGDAAAAFVMQNAWLVFMLPYSIIVMAIGTPYFTQLSEHAAAGRDDDVRADIGRSIRTLGVLIVIATAALVAASVPATRVFVNEADQAIAAAPVLVAYLVGLIPLAVLFIVQRTFYAYGDTRTPFFFTLFQGVLIVVSAQLAGAFMPVENLAAAVALGQSLASLAQVIVATLLLRRKIGSIGMGRSLWALARFALAAIPAGAAGWAVFVWAGGGAGWMTANELLGAVGTALIGGICLLVYGGILAIFRAPELKTVTELVQRTLKR